MSLEYALVDLEPVRAHRLIEFAIRSGREQINRDKVTTFTWLTIDECAAAGAILEVSLTSTGWRLAHPREVPWAHRTSDWLCPDCGRQRVLRDGVCGGCWLKRWKAAGAA